MSITLDAPTVTTLRDVFDAALAAYRAARGTARDDAFRVLEDAARAAGLDLCHYCVGAADADADQRSCCLELVCDACGDEHDLLCDDLDREDVHCEY